MTDAEKELKRLAEGAKRGGFIGPPHLEFTAKVTPSAVLALLDRIEALEKSERGWQDYADEREKHWQSEVAAAERKGAEEMRERAADEAWRVGAIDGVSSSNLGEIGAGIRRLPLPGDAP